MFAIHGSANPDANLIASKRHFVSGTGLSASESLAVAYASRAQVPDVLRGVCVAEKATPSARVLRMQAAEARRNVRAIERAEREAAKAAAREAKAAAKLAAKEAAKAAKTTERTLADLSDLGILVEWYENGDPSDDVAEVSGLVTDPAFGPGVWVRLITAKGRVRDLHEDDWAELGEDVEIALMEAYDRIPVGTLLV